MSVTVTTRVNSRGRTREMLAFYAEVFGGEPVLASYGDIHSARTAGPGRHRLRRAPLALRVQHRRP